MRHRPVRKRHWPSGPRLTSLLRATERLSPQELVLTIPPLMDTPIIDLPVFPRATSIRLVATFLRVRLPPSAAEGHFSALQALYLSGCIVHDLHAMVSRCPRLRGLTYKAPGGDNLKVHSASLEELVVENECAMTCSVDISGPMLKQLTSAVLARPGISVSILAPMLETLSYKCLYYIPYSFRHWGLTSFSLTMATSPVHAPSLEIYAYFGFTSFRDANYSFAQEIQKHLLADISVLNLHLLMRGHVFGEFVLHLLERDRIRTAIRRLNVDLLKCEDHGDLYIYCSCHDDEMSWRTQTISLPHLEEVEIDGIKGVDHELDFLKLLLRCAPILTRMTVRLSEMLTTTDDACKKIYNIFKTHPSLECYVYLGTDKQVLHA
uniref:Uncharacterized protein n=1 Tax=Avena sativa TaxID=4498 RepID=A0ACD5TGJ4_AVESA